MTYSSIVSYHTNPYTCGVARFNQALAQSLGIRVISVSDFITAPDSFPLLSIKLEEIPDAIVVQLLAAVTKVKFDAFLHGVQGSRTEKDLLQRARKLFVASEEHSAELRSIRPDIITVFAPGASPTESEGTFDLTLLTFGMAHKIRASGYRKLGEILKSDSRSLQLEISTALHEGTSFSEEFFSVGSEISEAFAGNVRFLGFLSDVEVSSRLRKADALIAFFPNGARENNTTVLSAMSHGCAVITNLDNFSPVWMKHGESIFDINKLSEFPSALEFQIVRDGAVKAVAPYSFETLSAILMNWIA
jgi:hypothetical protein